jgi:long-chain acyl-CoA synthetase
MNTKPQRLFEILPYYKETYSHNTLFGHKVDGVYVPITVDECIATTQKFAAGLIDLGIGYNDGTAEGRDKIAILSSNKPQWLLADIGTQLTGAIFVPIYPTSGENDIEFIFNHANIKYVLVGDEDLYNKVSASLPKTPTVKGVYCLEKVAGIPFWESIFVEPNEAHKTVLKHVADTLPKDEIATIIYTSGTTGTPKGVMLSHWNIMSNVYNSIESFPFRKGNGDRILSFLPLNHIFERMVSYMYMTQGFSIYYAEALETIGANLKEVQPVGFSTVPRLLEKVYETIMAKADNLSGVKRKLFNWAVELGLKYDNIKSGGLLYNIQLAIANKLIFSKWREGLGGKIEFIVTGASACQVRLLRIFSAAKLPIYEGYGPSENSPVITVNRMDNMGRKFGTVGPTINGQILKLEADGEICVKGPSVMMGYYKRQDLTDETIIDGWLHTGDIGVFEKQGQFELLKITDRKKELFKTSGGKYVAPQPIENKMRESNYVEQMIVVGADEKFVGALIVPNFHNLLAWCKQKNINETEPAALIRLPQVEQLFEDIVNGFNPEFNPVERIKKFELLAHEWTVNTGELTPTMKLKRKVIMEKYGAEVAKIYA